MAKKLLCIACQHVGEAKRVTRGSIWIELVMWLFFLLPGLIYSIWRLTTRHDACERCGGKSLIPLDSPAAKKMLSA